MVEYTLKLTEKEVNTILSTLAKEVWHVSNDTIVNIQQQCSQQNDDTGSNSKKLKSV